ncbi:uncharacterized protein LOC119113598 [Pollicipes pollicipes]|uniref:uncharacterized protein LOC119113598 n=1 Tax=Pollicipes pollicipes TaxID=41117 RepID=UPI001884EDE2|nr:uncharacterized protein LOC119113598 [Pollicipes pollicipes]
MLKELCECLKKLRKAQLFALLCAAGAIFVLLNAGWLYQNREVVEVFDHTGSMSQETLEIILCPMPRVTTEKIAHFGLETQGFTNNNFIRKVIWPWIHPHNNNSTNTKAKIFVTILHCLIRSRLFKITDAIYDMLDAMFWYKGCFPAELVNGSKALQDQFMSPEFVQNTKQAFEDKLGMYLKSMFGSRDKERLEDYMELFQLTKVLKHRDLTITDLLKFIGLDLQTYIDQKVLDISLKDVTRPQHILEKDTINTRMAFKCFRHVLHNNSEPGHQRSKITYFFRNYCPWEPSHLYPKGSYCITINEMYLTMHVNAFSQYTDVPAVRTFAPIRLPTDQPSVVHVAARKLVHTRRMCKSYPRGESKVTCVEDCLFRIILENITCAVPWINRLQMRFKNLYTLPTCVTQSDANWTRSVVVKWFDSTPDDACQRLCAPDCQELIISPTVRSNLAGDRPQLVVLLSDQLPVFREMVTYDMGQLLVEATAILGFLLGVSLVACCDWLLGASLWLTGRLPLLPALPPIVKRELHTGGIWRRVPCGSCGKRRPDSGGSDEQRGPAAARSEPDGPAFPAIAVRTSVFSTVMQVLGLLDRYVEPQRRQEPGQGHLEWAFTMGRAERRRLPLLEKLPRNSPLVDDEDKEHAETPEHRLLDTEMLAMFVAPTGRNKRAHTLFQAVGVTKGSSQYNMDGWEEHEKRHGSDASAPDHFPHDAQYDPHHDPQYDPRYDSQYDPQYDPQYDRHSYPSSHPHYGSALDPQPRTLPEATPDTAPAPGPPSAPASTPPSGSVPAPRAAGSQTAPEQAKSTLPKIDAPNRSGSPTSPRGREPSLAGTSGGKRRWPSRREPSLAQNQSQTLPAEPPEPADEGAGASKKED